jgi:hypothetical protein
VGTSLEVATDLLHQASLAAQMAAGRSNDRILVFSAAEAERIRDVTRLDHLLRRAIAGREFRLNYQPIVDLRSRELVGLEGLVRWAVPEGDLQPPNAFMSIAEASGLISEISTLVIEIATRQLTDWKSAGWVAPRLTLNVAAAQLQEADFLAGLVKAASSGHLNPAQLELDIIGGGGTVWSTAARQRLAVLRDMQVTLALDDFGTGDASLQWLRDLPVSWHRRSPNASPPTAATAPSSRRSSPWRTRLTSTSSRRASNTTTRSRLCSNVAAAPDRATCFRNLCRRQICCAAPGTWRGARRSGRRPVACQILTKSYSRLCDGVGEISSRHARRHGGQQYERFRWLRCRSGGRLVFRDRGPVGKPRLGPTDHDCR